MTHNNLTQLNFMQYMIQYKEAEVFFKHLDIIFKLLNNNQTNSLKFNDMINNIQFKVDNNIPYYLGDADIIGLLKNALNKNFYINKYNIYFRRN